MQKFVGKTYEIVNLLTSDEDMKILREDSKTKVRNKFCKLGPSLQPCAAAES